MAKMSHFTTSELDRIIDRCRNEEYTCFLSFYGNKVNVSLEKGSTYGKMYMKFSADADTASEAFEKCVLNFPPNPVGAIWDTKRIEAHHAEPIDTTATDANDIPF